MVPGPPAFSIPIASRISATESPTAGVGASDRSTMPNRAGGPRRRATSRPISSPARVTLKAMRLMVSATVDRSCASPLARRRLSADSTTPGPEQPTLITHSPSLTPCMAPATNGLSSGMFANVTRRAQPMPPSFAVPSATALTTRPISSAASMLRPARVLAMFTDEQTRAVVASASGIESMSARSPGVIPFSTSAEKPPM